jgi:Predicted membrane protein
VRIIIRWILGALALYLTVWLGQQLGVGLALKSGIVPALVAVAVLSLVNAVFGNLLRLLTLPLNCLTFGLLGVIINALMFLLVGRLDVGLVVRDFWAALFGSVVMSIISGFLGMFVGEGGRDEPRRRRKDD